MSAWSELHSRARRPRERTPTEAVALFEGIIHSARPQPGLAAQSTWRALLAAGEKDRATPAGGGNRRAPGGDPIETFKAINLPGKIRRARLPPPPSPSIAASRNTAMPSRGENEEALVNQRLSKRLPDRSGLLDKLPTPAGVERCWAAGHRVLSILYVPLNGYRCRPGAPGELEVIGDQTEMARVHGAQARDGPGKLSDRGAVLDSRTQGATCTAKTKVPLLVCA
jgi:hypothetical protein